MGTLIDIGALVAIALMVLGLFIAIAPVGIWLNLRAMKSQMEINNQIMNSIRGVLMAIEQQGRPKVEKEPDAPKVQEPEKMSCPHCSGPLFVADLKLGENRCSHCSGVIEIVKPRKIPLPPPRTASQYFNG